MTALVCSVQLAVDFQARSATLASGNRGEYGEVQFAGIVEEILYPTLSNQHIHVYYILRFAYLGLFSTSTPKGSKRNSQGMSGQVDMMSISLNIRQSIRFTGETRNRIFGIIWVNLYIS